MPEAFNAERPTAVLLSAAAVLLRRLLALKPQPLRGLLLNNMATIVQLSETTYLNLDTVTVLRREEGEWRVYFNDHAHSLALTAEETAVLALYLRNHTERIAYDDVWRKRQSVTP